MSNTAISRLCNIKQGTNLYLIILSASYRMVPKYFLELVWQALYSITVSIFCQKCHLYYKTLKSELSNSRMKLFHQRFLSTRQFLFAPFLCRLLNQSILILKMKAVKTCNIFSLFQIFFLEHFQERFEIEYSFSFLFHFQILNFQIFKAIQSLSKSPSNVFPR